MARQYIDCGLSALNYYIPDFDAASDIFEMYAPVENQQEFARGDRNSALNFRHPMTFTEMTTLATFVAQILFGGEQARSVEPRKDLDSNAADAINGLLAWNDARLSIYLQGYLWVLDCLVYNRGVWYESSGSDVTIEREEIEEKDVTADKVPMFKENGDPRVSRTTSEPILGYPTIKRTRNRRIYSGFYNKIDLVSPYDFVCDPSLPPARFQEGRFAGHRVMIPWIELKRRSQLDPTDDAYVLPHVVNKIKTQKGNTITPAAMGGTQGLNTSRTYYERQLRGANAAGIGGVGAGLVAGSDAVNKQDGGTIECFNMVVRAKPKTLGLYPDDEEEELINFLITNQADVLSFNILPNQHDEFPYAVGEARPNGHRQFSPGYALAIKPVQDRIDELNNTHARAQARMGNILLIDSTKCDASNLLARDKNGLMILKTEEGRSSSWEEIIKQIPLTDVTAGYNEEISMWKGEAEAATGAHAYVQGTTDNEEQTATQFAGTQEMSTGRISSIARILSEGAITKQTRRFVENFKQFMPEEQVIKVLGKGSEFDPDDPQDKFRIVKKADIQCEFDVTPHDGSLPGADAQVVAAASRAIEAWSTNPNLAIAFDNTVPGSMDPVRILRMMLKKSGLRVEQFSVTRQQAQDNLRAKQLAAGVPPMQPPPDDSAPPAAAAPVPVMPTGAGPIAGAESIPATPPAVAT